MPAYKLNKKLLFYFEAVYPEIKSMVSFGYGLEGRNVKVDFIDIGDGIGIKVTFDPETQNPIEMQRDGWKAIPNNFKKYTETN